MISIVSFGKKKDSGKTTSSGKVSIIRENSSAGYANTAGYANKAGTAEKATYAERAGIAETLSENSEVFDKIYDKALLKGGDEATGLIAFLEGLITGRYSIGVNNSGASIDKYGNAEFESVILRDLLKAFSGAEFGNFVRGASGAALYMDDEGLWHCETDFMHVRHKLTAKEVQIEEVTHIGGQQLLTAAQMNCAFVADKGDYYRCFFNKEGSDGRKVTNKWKTGDQAYACTFNLEEQADGTLGNHYFWRLVTGTSNDGADTSEYEVDGETVNGGDYHYIDLSKSVASSGSDEPKPGDNIVQLGYRGTDVGASERQAAILMAGAGNASPYIREFTGINSFSLPEPDIQLKPGDNILTGRVRMTAGSTLNGIDLGQTITQLGDKADAALGNAAAAQSTADAANTAASNAATAAQTAQTAANNAQTSADQANTTANATATTVANLSTGNQNLLRNSGFTGDYLPENSATSVEVNDGTFLFSNPFDHWTTTNATAISSVESVTGMAVVLTNGSLQQTLETPLIANGNYIFSFKAKGTSISFTIGSYSDTQALTNTATRYTFKFVAQSASTAFAITSSTCTVMELQLVQGTVPNTDWINNPNDNDKALAYFQNLTYLTNAIVNGSTSILGGLILSNQIRVGNYRNGSMVQETGGIASQSSYTFEESGGTSGLYSGPNSPFLWGGGTMEKAFYTIAKYDENPNYEPSASELANLMAQFVVTHGGRAILNNIIARGAIFATSGIFKNIASPNGNFRIDESGNAFLSIGGRIGGFTIRGDGLTNIDDEGEFKNDAYVILRNDSHKCFVGIGPNVLSSYSTARALARYEIEDNDDWFGSGANIALVLRAKNNTRNFAFMGEGNGVLNGWIDGFKFTKITLSTANTIYYGTGYLELKTNNRFFVYSSVSNSGVSLPRLTEVRSALCVDSSTNFAVLLTIIADLGSNNFLVRGRCSIQDGGGNTPWNTTELPLITHWDGGRWEETEMGKGDSITYLLVYDSSNTISIDGFSCKYTARVINKQD